MREKVHHRGQEQVRPHCKAVEPEKSDSQQMSDLDVDGVWPSGPRITHVYPWKNNTKVAFPQAWN